MPPSSRRKARSSSIKSAIRLSTDPDPLCAMSSTDTAALDKPADTKPKRSKVNLRTPEVMEAVQAQVESHYRSAVVERLRAQGGSISKGNLTVKLAKQFGFCYGVERAIDLAYAARKV